MQAMENCDLKRKIEKMKKPKELKKESVPVEDPKPKFFHDIGRDKQFEELCNKWNATGTDT